MTNLQESVISPTEIRNAFRSTIPDTRVIYCRKPKGFSGYSLKEASRSGGLAVSKQGEVFVPNSFIFNSNGTRNQDYNGLRKYLLRGRAEDFDPEYPNEQLLVSSGVIYTFQP